MSHKPRAKSLADIVAELEAAPRAEAAPRRPGLSADGSLLCDTGGHVYRLSVRELTPAEAMQSVRGAASVAFDSCGCGGSNLFCRTRWLTPAEIESLRGGSAPTLEHDSVAWIELWDGSSGSALFIHGEVTWNPVI